MIGNGDINCVDDYKKMIDLTGCDAVMVARGALGNPWIFKQIKDFIKNGKYDSVSLKSKINLCKEHYSLLKEEKNEQLCLNLTKKHYTFVFDEKTLYLNLLFF